MGNLSLEEMNKYYEIAKKHHADHTCGGAPYKNYRELYEFLEQQPQFSGISGKVSILEIGTAIGLMTYFFTNLYSNAEMQSLEIENEHVVMAGKLLRNFPAPNPQNLQIINCEAISYMQYCPANIYNIIFFDGFAPTLEFLKEYERILKKDGILISANSHLSLSKTREYFEKLEDENKWKKLTSFGDTIIYQKLL